MNIGPIHKKDIMKASAMLEHDDQYVILLALMIIFVHASFPICRVIHVLLVVDMLLFWLLM